MEFDDERIFSYLFEPGRGPSEARELQKSTAAEISVLHVSHGIGKTARAAILRYQFGPRGALRNSALQRFLRLKNTYPPQLYFT